VSATSPGPGSSAPFLIDDRYCAEHFLAAGGFGEVWRATDRLLRREVAVKLLHPGFARHPEVLARFRAEAQHAAALCHENIARIYDYNEPAGAAPYLVMELVRGPSLAEVLAAGPLAPARVAGLVAQAAAGLHIAHQAGLVHRDVKPGNLLIGPEETVKITDFGISHAAGAVPLTCTGQLMGTPGYLAPERACGAQATPASDLYALGVVAWECLAGTAPFTGSSIEVAVAHRDRPLPPLPASVPDGLAALVAELTAKHPAARPADAGEVAWRAARLRSGLLAAGRPAAVAAAAPNPTMELDELPAAAPAHRRWRHRAGSHRARQVIASADRLIAPRRAAARPAA
jgi:eukaryotic-like serine/threonine-protein kinase